MTDIEALLARLKELDPETWERIHKFAAYEATATPWNSQAEECLVGWTIQGVIQEAIAANDDLHGYEIVYTSWADGVTYETEIFWDMTPEELKGFGDSPAEALLAAYIKALEAQQQGAEK